MGRSSMFIINAKDNISENEWLNDVDIDVVRYVAPMKTMRRKMIYE
jgi:hypothetical protein